MNIADNGDVISVDMTRDEYFIVLSLMGEAIENGDERDVQTRVGATMDEVRNMIDSLPRIPVEPRFDD